MIPLINSAMHLLEDDRDEFCEKYEDTIAPLHMDLPTVMTMFEPDERADAYRRMQKYVGKNGLWTGTVGKTRKDGSGGRPRFSYVTRSSLKEQAEGKRSLRTTAKKTSSGRVIDYVQHSRVSAVPSHLVLVNDRRYPTERRNHASHLCHNSLCVLPDHLEWSSANDNQRREMCHERGKCVCGLVPKCIFTAH